MINMERQPVLREYENRDPGSQNDFVKLSELRVIVSWSLAILVDVCTLPSAFAGGNCQSCIERPLQSPEQCNMSNDATFCTGLGQCIALTAELMNGTLVGMRGCWGGECTNIRVCVSLNKSLPDGVYFKRCVAECCFPGGLCNKGLFPMLPELPSPSSVRVIISSQMAGPVNASKASTTQAPTSAVIKMKSFLFLPILLLVITDIMM
ncbi:uncharacterized protein LOC144652951 isoform X1 [Oculina patagonica]